MFRTRDGDDYYEITYKTKPEPPGNPDPVAETYKSISKKRVDLSGLEITEIKASPVFELDSIDNLSRD
jgi:hypothetical protein